VNTYPDSGQNDEKETALLVSASYRDQDSGATWVHKDLVQTIKPWELEEHVSPPDVTLPFGDVESFAKYVTTHAAKPFTLLTWNSAGLKGVLDHHPVLDSGEDNANPSINPRGKWIATYPFRLHPTFKAWSEVANGKPVAQQPLVEFLADHAEEIIEPGSTALLDLLRTLRGNASSKGTTELNPDGTSRVHFERETQVRGGAGTETVLPAEIVIRTPVLMGHIATETDDLKGDVAGQPVAYKITLTLRVNVGDDARLAFRIGMPAREIILEQVYLERVAEARTLLGDGYDLLRATDH
jgi:hypothetical protein